MKKIIPKVLIQNKRRKFFSLVLSITLFVRSPKLTNSTRTNFSNSKNIALEIVHRPSRGGAVWEADAFELLSRKNTRNLGGNNQNKFSPFNLFLPPQVGNKPNSVIDFRTMSNAGLPTIHSGVKSLNEYLLRNKIPDTAMNRNSLKDLNGVFPVANVEELWTSVGELVTSPEVSFLLSKLLELAAEKGKNICSNTFVPDNDSLLINSVQKKAMAAMANNHINQRYRKAFFKPFILDSRGKPSIFLSREKIDQLISDFQTTEKVRVKKAVPNCPSQFKSEIDINSPTLLEKPTNNLRLGYQNFTYDRDGKNYSINIGRSQFQRSTASDLTTEKLIFDKISESMKFDGNNKVYLDKTMKKYSFSIDFEQARNKYHHANDFGLEMTPTFNRTHYDTLKRSETQKKYLAKVAPMEAVNEFRLAVKNHVLAQDTKMIMGTHLLYPPVPVYHFFDEKTSNNCFFNINNQTNVAEFVSGWTLTDDQVDYLHWNGNFYNKTRPE